MSPIALIVLVSSIPYISRPQVADSGSSGLDDNNFLNDSVDAKAKMDALGHAVTLLPQGQIILLAPKAMTVGDEQRVEARVGLNVSFDQIAKSVSSTLNVERGTLHVSPEMIATLDGAGFKVSPITPEKQSIGEGLATAWSWNVIAEREGDRELNATLYALVSTPNSEVRQRIDSYTQDIDVAVRAKTLGEWLDYLSKEAKSLNGLVVAGVGILTALGISLRWRHKGRSGAKEKAIRSKPLGLID
jgi:hypothetical protein